MDLDSALIRRLFSARSLSSDTPPLTNCERRAANTAADSEDTIGLASLGDVQPVHFDIEDWDSSRRLNFDWDKLCELADFCPCIILAESARVVRRRPYFVECRVVSETSVRLRHRFEWMAIIQTDHTLTWDDFEVARISRKPSHYPLVLRLLSHVAPQGLRLAYPSLLFTRFYAHFFDRRVRDLPTMETRKKLWEALEISRRWERLVEIELCRCLLYWAIIERRHHAHVSVLPMDLFDLIFDSLADNLMRILYLSSHYGSPRDIVNDLLHANSIGGQNEELVYVLLSSELVWYVWLDHLLDKSIARMEVKNLLPIENGAVGPRFKKARLAMKIKKNSDEGEHRKRCLPVVWQIDR